MGIFFINPNRRSIHLQSNRSGSSMGVSLVCFYRPTSLTGLMGSTGFGGCNSIKLVGLKTPTQSFPGRTRG